MIHCSFILDSDTFSLGELTRMAPKLKEVPSVWGVKVGDSAEEHGLVAIAAALNGLPYFYDCKKFDTPDRLERSVSRIAQMHRPPQFLTLGPNLDAEDIARVVAVRGNINIIAVPLLSSTTSKWCGRLYGGSKSKEEAFGLNLAQAYTARVQGITCPANLLDYKNNLMGRLISPPIVIATGVRSDGVAANNHVGPMSPEYASRQGATHIIIGREATESPNPIATLRAIAERCARVSTK